MAIKQVGESGNHQPFTLRKWKPQSKRPVMQCQYRRKSWKLPGESHVKFDFLSNGSCQKYDLSRINFPVCECVCICVCVSILLPFVLSGSPEFCTVLHTFRVGLPPLFHWQWIIFTDVPEVCFNNFLKNFQSSQFCQIILVTTVG
jgi:hypothetical protein